MQSQKTKTPKKRRPWPEKRRKQQAKTIRETKPWTRSTGPRTAAGKVAAAANALKSGLYTAEMKTLRQVLRAQAAFLRTCLPPPAVLAEKSASPSAENKRTAKPVLQRDDGAGKDDSPLPPTDEQVR